MHNNSIILIFCIAVSVIIIVTIIIIIVAVIIAIRKRRKKRAMPLLTKPGTDSEPLLSKEEMLAKDGLMNAAENIYQDPKEEDPYSY